MNVMLVCFSWKVWKTDIRDLISIDDAVEEMKLGPNGGLVFCIEYLSQNMEWLEDELSQFDEDGYFLFDCPGTYRMAWMTVRSDWALLPLLLPRRHYKSTHRIRLPPYFRLSRFQINRYFILDGLPFHFGWVQVHIGKSDGAVIDASAGSPSLKCTAFASIFPVDSYKVWFGNAGYVG